MFLWGCFGGWCGCRWEFGGETVTIWIPDSLGVRYSNGKITWLGRPPENWTFWTINRHYQSGFQITIRIPDHLTTGHKSTIPDFRSPLFTGGHLLNYIFLPGSVPWPDNPDPWEPRVPSDHSGVRILRRVSQEVRQHHGLEILHWDLRLPQLVRHHRRKGKQTWDSNYPKSGHLKSGVFLCPDFEWLNSRDLARHL